MTIQFSFNNGVLVGLRIPDIHRQPVLGLINFASAICGPEQVGTLWYHLKSNLGEFALLGPIPTKEKIALPNYDLFQRDRRLKKNLEHSNDLHSSYLENKTDKKS